MSSRCELRWPLELIKVYHANTYFSSYFIHSNNVILVVNQDLLIKQLRVLFASEGILFKPILQIYIIFMVLIVSLLYIIFICT